MTRVAILDDYQDVAREFGDWDSLDAEVVVFRAPLEDIGQLEPFDVIMAMRERTPFPRERLERLPEPQAAGHDRDGQRRDRHRRCPRARHHRRRHRRARRRHTAELTWGLILALARHIPAEDRALREGGWQHTVGLELAGLTLGVIGLGRLGSQVARIGEAFGMDVIAWSQNLDTPLTCKEELLAAFRHRHDPRAVERAHARADRCRASLRR